MGMISDADLIGVASGADAGTQISGIADMKTRQRIAATRMFPDILAQEVRESR
jgi:hypothetical protein